MRDHPAARSLGVECSADVINSAVTDHKTRSSIEARNQILSLGLLEESLVFLASRDILRTRIHEAGNDRARRRVSFSQRPNQPSESSASTSPRIASAERCSNLQALRNE